jgi:uncharacterized membrane protein
MSIGVIVVCVAITEDANASENDKAFFNRIRLYILSYFMVWAFVFCTASFCGSVVLER